MEPACSSKVLIIRGAARRAHGGREPEKYTPLRRTREASTLDSYAFYARLVSRIRRAPLAFAAILSELDAARIRAERRVPTFTDDRARGAFHLSTGFRDFDRSRAQVEVKFTRVYTRSDRSSYRAGAGLNAPLRFRRAATRLRARALAESYALYRPDR